MSTLTFILLIYVILDIILDTTAIILLKRKGITLRGMANQIRWVFSKPYRNHDYDTDEWESHDHTNQDFTEEDYLDEDDDDILA